MNNNHLKSRYSLWLTFLIKIIFLNLVTANDYENNTDNNYCVDLKPQTSLDMDQLMGMWHGVEIIQHQPRDHHIVPDRICPVILISDSASNTETPSPYEYGYNDYGYPNNNNLRRGRNRGFRRQYWRNMSLLWDEGSFTVEYLLRYDQSKPGLWISSGPQNSSSSLMDKKFNSFTGHVQVLKAVGTHLVLTFCHIYPNNELFSVVLSRTLELNQQDLLSIHNLLTRRHLNNYHIQKVCRNNSINIQCNLYLIFISVITLFLYNIKKH